MRPLVIFDLDGTLLDTIGDLAASCNEILLRHDLPTHPVKSYRIFVGNGITKLIERALPQDRREEEFVLSLRQEFVEYYSAHIDTYSKCYEGIPELLRELSKSGFNIAVSSNKFHSGTVKLIERFFPDVNFVAIFGQRDGIPLKPDPATDLEIISMCKALPAMCWHVGDSLPDIEAAKRAGIHSIGVSWGFRPLEELKKAGADHIADTPQDIFNIVVGESL